MTGRSLNTLVGCIDPDLIHLHWVADGFFDIAELSAFSRPLVWTLHDSWPFTGGCHYPRDCSGYERQCGRCPLLGSDDAHDLSRRVFERKQRAYSECSMAVVSPSRWLAAKARASRLLGNNRTVCIPYGLDLECFSPAGRDRSRRELGLATGQKLILAGAAGFRDDPRKGYDLFCDTVSCLERLDHPPYVFAIFGGKAPELISLDGIEIRELGSLKPGAEVAGVFAAADLFVAASREDNFPNTVCESLACGTPAAGFSIGGLPEMIDDPVNGCLAQAFDPVELAAKMNTLLMDERGASARRSAVRRTAERLFSMSTSVESYVRLYSQIISSE